MNYAWIARVQEFPSLQSEACQYLQLIETERTMTNEIYISGVRPGARQGNHNGGSGAVVIVQNTTLELAQGYSATTNARMELRAAIAALRTLPPEVEVTVNTGLKFIEEAFNLGWLEGWQAKSWRKSGNKPVQNKDLWLELLAAMQGHTVHWQWLVGYSADPMGERAIALAQMAAQGPFLQDINETIPNVVARY